MRITNNMMINNTSSNINGNKINVNALNLQMSSQKKIQRPSENPIVAIRALRLRSTLSQIQQYNEKNIPDAEAWMRATETALYNMNGILTDVKSECVTGTNSYLTAQDRDTILKNLTALKSQLYSEGNADNAGRTVFTGWRTGSQLTFMEDEADTTYRLYQTFSYEDMEEYSYFGNRLEVPTTVAEVQDTDKIKDDYDFVQHDYERIRLPYDNITDIESLTLYRDDGSTIRNRTIEYFDTEADWENKYNGKSMGAGHVFVIRDTGEIILGPTIGELVKSSHGTIEIQYTKTGFAEGELRPEYYYDCTDITDPNRQIEYKKYDENGNKIYEDINYTVALNQTLTVNLQADEVFDMNIYQDVVDMLNAVQNAIDAHDKVTRLEAMKNEAKYADCQADVQKWIDAAQKEADYADTYLTKLFTRENAKFDQYIEKLNIAYTEIGSRGDQLEMTQARIDNLQLTQEELMSSNEDKELSDVIIEYTAAFNAYQASLMAAAKIEKQTLLDYI